MTLQNNINTMIWKLVLTKMWHVPSSASGTETLDRNVNIFVVRKVLIKKKMCIRIIEMWLSSCGDMFTMIAFIMLLIPTCITRIDYRFSITSRIHEIMIAYNDASLTDLRSGNDNFACCQCYQRRIFCCSKGIIMEAWWSVITIIHEVLVNA